MGLRLLFIIKLYIYYFIKELYNGQIFYYHNIYTFSELHQKRYNIYYIW